MKTVLENQFLKMNFDSSRNLMETSWTTTAMMTQKKFRDILGLYLELLEICQPIKLLVNSIQAEYIIIPEDQDWINTYVYQRMVNAGIKKIAFLVGTDLFMNLSLEQVVEDSQSNIAFQIEQKFFENYQDALNWLKQDDL